ncbi:MAG: MmcQ/YjbR family DNA-binding protein [Phycisphaerales bacterium]|nr:MmcQ/YjbR family DNA-binding protein [Phycisphaerales bacterium]
MAKRAADPSEVLREAARAYADVDEGMSCSQTSFKVRGKAFLFVGEQGGRFKAMFKLDDSLDQAESLAADAPKDVQVGKNGWVTARFTTEQPMAARVWKKWLKESYALAAG